MVTEHKKPVKNIEKSAVKNVDKSVMKNTDKSGVKESEKNPVKSAGTNKTPQKDLRAAETEFESLVMKNIPGWTAVWKMMLQDSKDFRKKQFGRTKPVDLQKRIRMKITELVDEEESLVDLYTKAAEAAKKKEEEFKGKTAVLIRQIEKDKNLMKMYKQAN